MLAHPELTGKRGLERRSVERACKGFVLSDGVGPTGDRLVGALFVVSSVELGDQAAQPARALVSETCLRAESKRAGSPDGLERYRAGWLLERLFVGERPIAITVLMPRGVTKLAALAGVTGKGPVACPPTGRAAGTGMGAGPT